MPIGLTKQGFLRYNTAYLKPKTVLLKGEDQMQATLWLVEDETTVFEMRIDGAPKFPVALHMHNSQNGEDRLDWPLPVFPTSLYNTIGDILKLSLKEQRLHSYKGTFVCEGEQGAMAGGDFVVDKSTEGKSAMFTFTDGSKSFKLPVSYDKLEKLQNVIWDFIPHN